MGLSIRFKAHKDVACPICGKIVCSMPLLEYDGRGYPIEVNSGGRVWYGFLKSIGYYKENDDVDEWYDKDMPLTKEQTGHLIKYCKERQPMYWRDIVSMVACLPDDAIVDVNADW